MHIDSPPALEPWWKRIISIERDPDPAPYGRDGCDYQGFEFGAGLYPDSICIEGYLWDADSGHGDGDGWTYTVGGDIPCPGCNRRAWRAEMREKYFEDAYEALHQRGAVFRRGVSGSRWMALTQQISACLVFAWEAIRR